VTADPFAVELAFERLAAELETETAEHVAGWWRQARAGGPPPPSPASLARASARRLLDEARQVPALTARATPWWRACLVAAVEADPRVSSARAQPWSWSALGPLAAARNRAARALGYDGFIALAADANGAAAAGGAGRDVLDGGPDALAATSAADISLPAVTPGDLLAVAGRLASRLRVDPAGLRVDLGPDHRTFVVTPGRDVRILVSGDRTVSAWLRALHEVGHGLAGATGARPSRAVDEAVATWASDRLTVAADVRELLSVPRPEAVAAAALEARHRRRRAAAVLADFELDLYRDSSGDLDARWQAATAAAGWTRAAAVPPPAFRDDPGAQPAYRAAEDLSGRLDAAIAAGASLIDAIAAVSA